MFLQKVGGGPPARGDFELKVFIIDFKMIVLSVLNVDPLRKVLT